jgi:hypothetical protein
MSHVLIFLFLSCNDAVRSYAMAVRNRIPFAAANLRAAGSAIQKHKSTYCIALSMLVLQIVWVVVWYRIT